MTTIEYLNRIVKEGKLNELTSRGVVPVNVILEIDVYNFYSAKIKIGWMKKNAIFETQRQFKIKQRKLYRIIEKMERGV